MYLRQGFLLQVFWHHNLAVEEQHLIANCEIPPNLPVWFQVLLSASSLRPSISAVLLDAATDGVVFLSLAVDLQATVRTQTMLVLPRIV